MAWEHLSINKPHLVYIILGGFTSLFMLCSSVIKERLYIGEATVATLCGIIFGPHAANLVDPSTWGNVDQITEEFSRIVLVVQCFAVGVELPRAYMEKHWRSVTFLLVPVMTFGWLITSLFVWGLFTPHLNWLQSLVVAACVTATDPVLAASVVGKGKFAKRVPKHLRDLLSAESGCNDGMAFPFVYLAIYIIHYAPSAGEVSLHWFGVTILYECVFGCLYGVIVGYTARRLIRYSYEHELIDRESFLVFYFVLALFCAGSGSLLGLDDLLVGFACGVGFSNDGWFTQQTEESHVSNVIDLLINLTFFVYFGTIIPWEQYNNGILGLDVWRLVVLGILVLLFRRIPIMMLLKPVIPDIKTWREALFAGHFGPIGVGAIFVAILARAELETDSTTPLSELPDPSTEHYATIYLVWPIVTFLVICSIVVHGSSIAVFTLGKHINTLSLSMSYTQANDTGNWMDRLPRIQSRSKTSMSIARSESSFDEKKDTSGQFPYGPPGTFLRRQKEEDNPSRAQSRASSRHRSRRSKNWDGHGPGGPISASAFGPTRRRDSADEPISRSDSDTLAVKSDPPSKEKDAASGDDDDNEATSPGQIWEEGHETVYEDDEGNVLAVEPTKDEPGPDREAHEREEGKRLMKLTHPNGESKVVPEDEAHHAVSRHTASKRSKDKQAKRDEPEQEDAAEEEKLEEEEREEPEALGKAPESSSRPTGLVRQSLNRIPTLSGIMASRDEKNKTKKSQEKEKKETRGPARAYQFGRTIIVEDEDGEVIKKYDIPGPEKKNKGHADPAKSHHRIGQMSKMLGLGGREAAEAAAEPGESGEKSTGARPRRGRAASNADEEDDPRLRFTMSTGGHRMSKEEFIEKIRSMDPKSRVEAVEDSNAPESVKREARKDYREQAAAAAKGRSSSQKVPVVDQSGKIDEEDEDADADADGGGGIIESADDSDEHELNLVDDQANTKIPFHDVSGELRQHKHASSETAAERRRRLAAQTNHRVEDDSEDDGTDRVPPSAPRSRGRAAHAANSDALDPSPDSDNGETAAERRRREGALGIRRDDDDDESDSDDAAAAANSNEPRLPPQARQRQSRRPAEPQQQPTLSPATTQPRQSALRWGENVGR